MKRKSPPLSLTLEKKQKEEAIDFWLVHKGRRYRFVFFFEKAPLPLFVQELISTLPQQLENQSLQTSLCPLPSISIPSREWCYFNTYPDPLTFFQHRWPVSPHISRRCSKMDREKCKESKEERVNQDISFAHSWDPYHADLLTHSPEAEEWNAYLVDFIVHKGGNPVIAAAAVGNKKKIALLEIHPEYRNQGLCTIFSKAIFDTYRRLGWSSILITNAGKVPADRCYRKAASETGFQLTCLLPKTNYCYKMQFH